MSTKKMTLSQVMKYLEQQGDEKVRLRHVRNGAGDDVFGVLLGTIRGLAETLGTNHPLGLELCPCVSRLGSMSFNETIGGEG